MSIYIAGPMTGLNNYNYQSFTVAQIWLESQGYEVRSPAILPHNWDKYEDYTSVTLSILGVCDKMCLLPGWSRSKGCLIEIEEAKKKGIEIIIPFKEDIWNVLLTVWDDANKKGVT